MKIHKKILISIIVGVGLFVLLLLGLVFYCGSVGAIVAYIDGKPVYIYPKKIDLGSHQPGAETVAVFYMKNLTTKEISIVGEKSSCTCAFSEQLPITAQPREVVELRIKIRLPKYESDYDQTISFMVTEPERLALHPVQVIDKVPNPITEPQTAELEEKGNNPSN